VFATLLLRTAWICDDAYISFRVADNLVHGYGLRWNAADRVQVYTNPLWTLSMAALYFITGDVYYTSLLSSIVISLGAAALLAFGVAATRHHALVALVLLSLSRAFVDYSTSGLENPLAHLLLVAFCLLYFRDEPGVRGLLRLAVVAALAALNRMDALILVGPPLLARAARFPPRAALKALVVGFLPLAAWMAFSFFYYGFPFPNSAYAKLNTGIPQSLLVQQGLLYLYNSLSLDPLTLLVVLLGASLPLGQRLPGALPFAVALVLDLVYVTLVGGDFMSGRFLAAPFLVAVACLARGPRPLTPGQVVAAVTLFGAVALSGPFPTLTTTAYYFSDRWQHRTLLDDTGITDERAIYYRSTGLLTARRGEAMPRYPRVDQGLRLRATGQEAFAHGQIGMLGFFAGPGVHIYEGNGLADAFIARLPSRADWRIGHFARSFPPGYEATARSGRNHLEDPRLFALYKRLARVTRGNLLDTERLLEIWDLNFGPGRHLADDYFQIHSRMQRVRLAAVAEPIDEVDWAARARPFSDYGIEVDLRSLRHPKTIEVSLDPLDTYRMQCVKGDVVLAEMPVPAGTRNRVLVLDQDSAHAGCDRLRFFPVSGDGGSLGHVRIAAEI
jgi:arabinofuranosyltransferase